MQPPKFTPPEPPQANDAEEPSDDAGSGRKLTPQQAKAAISGAAPRGEATKEARRADDEAGEAKAHIEGLIRFYKLRTKWSWFILGCIAVLLIFQVTITPLVGVGALNFEKYKWFLPLVITENLAQIISLALIVVNFLFSNSASKPLGFKAGALNMLAGSGMGPNKSRNQDDVD